MRIWGPGFRARDLGYLSRSNRKPNGKRTGSEMEPGVVWACERFRVEGLGFLVEWYKEPCIKACYLREGFGKFCVRRQGKAGKVSFYLLVLMLAC